MILLDTCALLWLVADQEKLSITARECIASYEGMIYVSAISAFEIAIKYQKKKLVLPIKPAEWFSLALTLHGIIELPVTSVYLVASAELPPHHQDPADRIIIATAQANQLEIITPDQYIKQYAGMRVIW
jgi:PIN domain nuclease of toxin-antitoxin system